MTPDRARIDALLPTRGLYYGGAFHAPVAGGAFPALDPATGMDLGTVPLGTEADAALAVAAGQAAFAGWRDTPPMERARMLREVAAVIRANIDDLAYLDAADGGNPITKVRQDVLQAAARFEYFAGLITEIKGETLPGRAGTATYVKREPLGVVARIVAFNHPFMFTASRMAAPLAAGNTVIIKPPEQASLSAIRLAELVGPLLPPGVFGILPGQGALGAALSAHRDVAMVGLVGSVPTGKAVMRAASDTLKHVLLELGGKNALIAWPDADPRQVAEAMVDGMNFTWCGQSCGSTSRAFLHEGIHDAVLAALPDALARYRPGLPLDPATTMGALIDRAQYDRVLGYIAKAQAEGARLVAGGGPPEAEALAQGCFFEPTVFAGVTPGMTIAREEIFGPVLGVLSWADEDTMFEAVNALDYGLTCSVWSTDLARAHAAADRVQAGYVWINEVSKHFPGAPFGGYKMSGLGREECLGELLAFTQEKCVHVNYSGKR